MLIGKVQLKSFNYVVGICMNVLSTLREQDVCCISEVWTFTDFVSLALAYKWEICEL